MIFKIPLKNGQIIYMHDNHLENTDIYKTVWVSVPKFLKIWKDEPYCQQTPDEWRKNRESLPWPPYNDNKKYKDCEICFNQSKKYPVPVMELSILLYPVNIAPNRICRKHFIKRCYYNFILALAKYHQSSKNKYCIARFDDGITRTMWLVTNGAKAFPVACSSENSNILEQYAGIDN